MQLIKNIHILVLILSALIFPAGKAAAQHVWPNNVLPFMPKRDTTHIHTRIEYELSDVVMGKRTPTDTTYFERHGYEMPRNSRLAFDSLDRITDRMIEKDDCEDIMHIEYNAEGVVKYFRNNIYCLHAGVAPDTVVHTYRLIDFTRHPQLGITRAVYRGAHIRVYEGETNEYDTLVCERVFDGRNRLIQTFIEGSWPNRMADEQTYLYYDANGYLSARKHQWGTHFDSIGYQHNIMAELIGGSGKGYDEDEEWDFLLSCTAKGIPVRTTTIYHISQFDEIAQQWMEVQSTYNVYYDRRGNVSRREVPDEPVKEFDYQYWDE